MLALRESCRLRAQEERDSLVAAVTAAAKAAAEEREESAKLLEAGEGDLKETAAKLEEAAAAVVEGAAAKVLVEQELQEHMEYCEGLEGVTFSSVPPVCSRRSGGMQPMPLDCRQVMPPDLQQQ